MQSSMTFYFSLASYRIVRAVRFAWRYWKTIAVLIDVWDCLTLTLGVFLQYGCFTLRFLQHQLPLLRLHLHFRSRLPREMPLQTRRLAT